MPASIMPFLIAGVSLLLLIGGLAGLLSIDGLSKKRSRTAIACGLGGLLLPAATMLAIRQVLWCGAILGCTDCQFTYSRFLESTPDIMQNLSLIPFDFHFSGSWYWLNKAAENGHIEASYAIGNRIKHDMFVPNHAGFSRDGQALMDEAIGRGFQLDVPEQDYYFGQFRIQPAI